jgi:hypothetical protein
VWTDLARAFRAIARSLRRGGTFLFDFIARVTDMSGPARIRETFVCRSTRSALPQ